jgi:tRNA nucleotidyltransferase/poly(A) polymerase
VRFNISENNFPILKQFSPIFETISIVAEEMDQPTFIIGGFVRDLMLGRKSKDIDIVTLGSGIEMAKGISKKTKKQPC